MHKVPASSQKGLGTGKVRAWPNGLPPLRPPNTSIEILDLGGRITITFVRLRFTPHTSTACCSFCRHTACKLCLSPLALARPRTSLRPEHATLVSHLFLISGWGFHAEVPGDLAAIRTRKPGYAILDEGRPGCGSNNRE
jgi:hypothetical protein